MTQGVKEWYDLAKMDLGAAKHLEAAYYPKPLEIICFHCQQAAKKELKQ
jgi:HEPN domain-containing protein